MIIVCVRRWTRRGKFVFVRDGALVEIRKLLGWAGILKSSFRFVFLIENRERENRYKGILFSVFSLDARSCKDEIYRMGIGGGYCEGNLNFATASEDDEVYTKKKVSRVSFRNDFDFQFPLGNRRRKWTRGEGARKKGRGKIRGYRRYLGQQRRRKVFRVVESNRLDSMMMQRLLYRRWQSRFSKTRIATHRPTGRNSIRYPRFTTTNLKKRVQGFLEFSINRTRFPSRWESAARETSHDYVPRRMHLLKVVDELFGSLTSRHMVGICLEFTSGPATFPPRLGNFHRWNNRYVKISTRAFDQIVGRCLHGELAILFDGPRS